MYWCLLGVLVVIVGFAIKLEPIAIIFVSAVVTAIAGSINVVDLLAKIKEDFSLEAEYIRRISEAEWLVLDDLGTEKVTEWSNGILYSILNKRTKTIITTNLSPRDIMGTYGKRVYSRIFKKTGLGTTNEHVYQFKTQQDKRMML